MWVETPGGQCVSVGQLTHTHTQSLLLRTSTLCLICLRLDLLVCKRAALVSLEYTQACWENVTCAGSWIYKGWCHKAICTAKGYMSYPQTSSPNIILTEISCSKWTDLRGIDAVWIHYKHKKDTASKKMILDLGIRKQSTMFSWVTWV